MSMHFFMEFIRPQVWSCKFLRGKWKWTFERLQYLAACTNFGWFLLSWYLAMCQIFCCCIIQGVSFNYHHRNVRSRVSVSNFQVSVSVSAFMTKSRSRLEIWARSRSRRLRSRLHHWLPGSSRPVTRGGEATPRKIFPPPVKICWT